MSSNKTQEMKNPALEIVKQDFTHWKQRVELIKTRRALAAAAGETTLESMRDPEVEFDGRLDEEFDRRCEEDIYRDIALELNLESTRTRKGRRE